MDLEKLLRGPLGRLPRPVASALFWAVEKIPAVKRRVGSEYESMLDGLRDEIKPYRDSRSFTSIPATGVERGEILAEMESMAARETDAWRDGLVSGAVYHGDREHLAFLDRVLSINSQVNPLHSDIWPSAAKFEAEIVAMAASMLGPGEEGICGTVTSGGTESILLAVKAHRDRAGLRKPEMVAPVTAHTAFDKAAAYFGVKLIRTSVDENSRADITAVADAVGDNTILIVGSAPSFPHGAIDPIGALAALAAERGIGFHTDACLGGFVLPWAEKLGYPIPPFDFRVRGVTSMSVDTHKYGYAPKGTSVVLYRSRELRRHQYFTAADWPGGLYFSPTLAGSRPGALSAGAWAAMVSIGESGYLEATGQILETGARIRSGIGSIPELEVIGDPLWVIAFRSDSVDVYRVMEKMRQAGWSLNGLHNPPAVHIAVTLRHTQPGVADRFISDLRKSVASVSGDPGKAEGMAPVYGLAATVPVRSMVDDLLERYIDMLYEA